MFLINPYILQASGGSSYLLDDYPGAFVAYSTRKISSTYMGSCIRIRRSSDNAEQDINFVSNDLDTASISSFCGGGIGYVVKWYDQSGNTADKSNSTAVNQPVIYNNGMITRNGKPYIQASSSQWLQLTSLQNVTGDFTFFITYEKNTTGNQAILFDGANTYSWLDYGLNQYQSTNFPVPISSVYNINTLYLNNTISLSASSSIYRNNTLIGTAGTKSGGSYLNRLPGNTLRTATIHFSEFIFYKADKTSDSPDINNNINNYFSIY